jgi:hypothetical protein
MKAKTRAGRPQFLTRVRKDIRMTWNEILEARGAVVGDQVEIVLDVEAVRRRLESGGPGWGRNVMRRPGGTDPRLPPTSLELARDVDELACHRTRFA